MTKSPIFPLLAAILSVSIVGAGLSLTLPLLAMRMETAGFSGQANGLSIAIAGLVTVLCSPRIPDLTRRMGARALLTLAAFLGAASLLCFAWISNPLWWFPIRIAFAFALTIFFVLGEYAVNALAPDEQRGLWTGVYGASLGCGFVLGPVILMMASAKGSTAFYIAALFFLIAGAPIIWVADQFPQISHQTSASALSIFLHNPILMLAPLLFGVVETGGMGLLPVYGIRNDFSPESGAWFVACISAGNVLFQIPVGLISDRVNRHYFLALIALASCLGSLMLLQTTNTPVIFFILLFFWGGVASTLYPVALAEIGSEYQGGALASANAAFIMLYAIGMLVGPPILGASIDYSPKIGLFGSLALLFFGYFLLLLKPYRSPKARSDHKSV